MGLGRGRRKGRKEGGARGGEERNGARSAPRSQRGGGGTGDSGRGEGKGRKRGKQEQNKLNSINVLSERRTISLVEFWFGERSTRHFGDLDEEGEQVGGWEVMAAEGGR